MDKTMMLTDNHQILQSKELCGSCSGGSHKLPQSLHLQYSLASSHNTLVRRYNIADTTTMMYLISSLSMRGLLALVVLELRVAPDRL